MPYRSAASRQLTPYLMDSNTFNECFVNCKMFFAFIANDIVILTMFACHTDYLIEGAYTKRLSKMYHGTSRFLYPLKQHYSQTEKMLNKRADSFLYPLKQHYSQTNGGSYGVNRWFLYHLKQHYSQTVDLPSPRFPVFLYHLKQHYSQTSAYVFAACSGFCTI